MFKRSFKLDSRWHNILMWIAVWLVALVALRLLGWGIGLACDGTVCTLI